MGRPGPSLYLRIFETEPVSQQPRGAARAEVKGRQEHYERTGSAIDQYTAAFWLLTRLTRPRAATRARRLGDAPMAYLLWHKYMKHNPKNSLWANRGSLCAFQRPCNPRCSIACCICRATSFRWKTCKQFRQWGSLTPGHPEYHHTGRYRSYDRPAGPGFCRQHRDGPPRKSIFRRCTTKPDLKIVDHYTYVICGDGRSDGRRLARGSLTCRYTATR